MFKLKNKNSAMLQGIMCLECDTQANPFRVDYINNSFVCVCCKNLIVFDFAVSVGMNKFKKIYDATEK